MLDGNWGTGLFIDDGIDDEYRGTYEPASGGSETTNPWATENMFPRQPSVGPRGDIYGGDVPG